MRSHLYTKAEPRAVFMMAVIFVILAFAAISAVGDIQAAQSDEAPNGQQPAESVEYEVGDDDDDSVTMAIEMDEGAVGDAFHDEDTCSTGSAIGPCLCVGFTLVVRLPRE